MLQEQKKTSTSTKEGGETEIETKVEVRSCRSQSLYKVLKEDERQTTQKCM